MAGRATLGGLAALLIVGVAAVAVHEHRSGSPDQARAIAGRHPAATDRDQCGGTVATDLHVWQARNVVATLSSCDFIDGRTQRASSPATAIINLAMHDLAGLPGETQAGR